MLMEIEKGNCICMHWLENSEQVPRWYWICIISSLLFFIESREKNIYISQAAGDLKVH